VAAQRAREIRASLQWRREERARLCDACHNGNRRVLEGKALERLREMDLPDVLKNNGALGELLRGNGPVAPGGASQVTEEEMKALAEWIKRAE